MRTGSDRRVHLSVPVQQNVTRNSVTPPSDGVISLFHTINVLPLCEKDGYDVKSESILGTNESKHANIDSSKDRYNIFVR